MKAAEIEAMFQRVKSWPVELQEELAEIASVLERRIDEPVDDETMAAIAEARAELARGEFVTEEQVEAMFARYRR